MLRLVKTCDIYFMQDKRYDFFFWIAFNRLSAAEPLRE